MTVMQIFLSNLSTISQLIFLKVFHTWTGNFLKSHFKFATFQFKDVNQVTYYYTYADYVMNKQNLS